KPPWGDGGRRAFYALSTYVQVHAGRVRSWAGTLSESTVKIPSNTHAEATFQPAYRTEYVHRDVRFVRAHAPVDPLRVSARSFRLMESFPARTSGGFASPASANVVG